MIKKECWDDMKVKGRSCQVSLAKIYQREMIKKECWDDMKVKGRSCQVSLAKIYQREMIKKNSCAKVEDKNYYI